MAVILKQKHNSEKNDFIFTNLKHKCNIAICLVVFFVFSITTAYAAPNYNSITIIDGEKEIKAYSQITTVEKAIDRQGIYISDYDDVVPARNTNVYDGIVIKIDRNKKVNVNYGGYNVLYYTKADTYGEFIKENNISVDDDDIVNFRHEDKLTSNDTIYVQKVTVTTEEVSEDIPYDSTKKKDSGLEKGKTKLLQKGKNGVKKYYYEVITKDGVETSRKLIGETITAEPVDEIVAVGTKESKKTEEPAAKDGLSVNVAGDSFKYKKMLKCTATAYDLSFESCGKRPGHPAYGITASGTYAKLGTVAVDPRVIPLGTKMYIVSADGQYVYGYCTAEDTGGAIKGNRVDLFYNTRNECMQFGRRSVYVYIL